MNQTQIKLKNPYLEAFDKYVMCDSSISSWNDWDARTDWKIEDGYSGPAWDRHMDDIVNSHTARRYLTKYCAYAVPNTEAIMAVADLKMPVVEMGAGNGYWAWMFEQAGIKVVAFDRSLDDYSNHWCVCEHWTTVSEGIPIVLKKYTDHALFLCWPPYDDPMAAKSLKAYSGNTLIFVGEDYGGCTGDEEFFEILEKNWSTVKEIDIPQWPGVHDAMSIYERV
jgi:hypothetical protein